MTKETTAFFIEEEEEEENRTRTKETCNLQDRSQQE
jgi:hypothetical protein